MTLLDRHPVKVSARELRALSVLGQHYGNEEGNCLYLRTIAAESGVEPHLVRRVLRSLARKGLARYERGLFRADDGLAAGSGYCCTDAGAILLGLREGPAPLMPPPRRPGELRLAWRRGLPPAGAPGQYLGKDADGQLWLLAWNPDGLCWSAIGFELNHPKPWPKLNQLHGDKAAFITGHVRAPDPAFVPGRPATAALPPAGGGAHEPA